ncbi:MAG: M23 family metallopeptidase [Gammaproteobacteria bacterium]|nr:M23 family metallopeptidase [Gammaproteobacteria bacterium]
MMDALLTARSHAANSSATSLFARHVAPAALGICAALLLGGSGFGLGCLYVRMSAPAAALAGPVGGPEEAAPSASVSRARSPAAASRGTERAISHPVAGGWVSSRYGPRPDPFTGLPAVHRGIDFAGPDNSAILAVAPGIVTWSGRQRGYGNFIEIDHGGGWVTRYGHNAFNLVTPGDYVKPGQTIALMGATGRATGTHLHFEVLYRGSHQDPDRFVRRAT